jgi:hypothetical protein
MPARYDNKVLPWVTRSRARRVEKQDQADKAAQRAAGLCDCGLPIVDGERCVVCAPRHKAVVKSAFEGL